MLKTKFFSKGLARTNGTKRNKKMQRFAKSNDNAKTKHIKPQLNHLILKKNYFMMQSMSDIYFIWQTKLSRFLMITVCLDKLLDYIFKNLNINKRHIFAVAL